MTVPKTEDLRVRDYLPLMPPKELKQKLPLSAKAQQTVIEGRETIQRIINKEDKRTLIIVGPCSIHDEKAALEYAERLVALQEKVKETLYLAMRVYFEKPRTTVGWKGLISDPELDDSCDMNAGLVKARGLILQIAEMGLPTATEMLEPITPQYLADLVCWSAIGARTTESQTHREMASGLSMPVGFKNGTDGNLQIAIDAMGAACHPHSFLGINREGRTSIVRTTGNPDVHIVLRGGNRKPNYEAADIAEVQKKLDQAGIKTSLMVDCSHANSQKDHKRQEAVMQDVMQQVAAGNGRIGSLMIESFIKEGSQKMADKLEDLEYGVSITDKCVDWETTERMLRHAHATLRECGGRRI